MEFRGGLRTLAAIYLVDAFVMQLPLVSFFVGGVVVLFGIADVVGGQAVRRGMLTIAAWLALDAAICGTIYARNAFMRFRAESFIAVLERYKSEHGHYPAPFSQCVPSLVCDGEKENGMKEAGAR